MFFHHFNQNDETNEIICCVKEVIASNENFISNITYRNK